MAGVGAACLPARAGTTLGVVRTTAPSRRRLERAEPWLRLAIPFFLSTFLLALICTAWVQLRHHRQEAIAKAAAEIDAIAVLAAAALSRPGPDGPSWGESRDAVLGGLLLSGGRVLHVTDQAGGVVVSHPKSAARAGSLSDLLGEAQAVTALADRAGVMRITLPDGEEALATVRNLRGGREQVAVVQSLAGALAVWHSRTLGHMAVLGAATLALLAIVLAYCVQASRARSANRMCDAVRRRVDAALSRGRCGLWDWDIARGRLYWSDSMYELLGYSRSDEFLSFGEVNALFHPEDGDLYSLARQLASSATSLIDHDFRMRAACGDWIWLRARAEVVQDSDDAAIRLVGIAVDITEQRRQAERNATADMRLRDAVDAISEAFVLWDEDNRLVLCNSKFQSLHGLAADTAVPGTTYAGVMQNGQMPTVRNEIVREPSQGVGARTFEAELADGRWLQVSERRTKDGGYVSVGTDITAMKRHEERLVESERRLLATIKDLKESRQALETQAQQLADLAERYLEQKAEAESASRSKSEFLANMSHELRTPLNAIIGFAEMMESGLFGCLGSPKYGEYCRDIRGSGQYLLSVIDDILDMSRIEAGRMRLSKSVLSLEDAIERALKLVAEGARAKDLAVSADPAPNVTLLADGRAVQQILVNILQNAVKFTPEGGRVSIKSRAVGDRVHIYVADTGIGIPKTSLPKLARPFEQVENDLTRTYKGSGLGLSIARSLCELHGGSLRIRSQEGAGTIVLVQLPRGAGLAPVPLPAHAAQHHQTVH